ncbi:MAG: exonuclease domain-containing protein [Bacteroidia bacterium]
MPYLIFDLEMTGSEAGYHDMIQIGAVLADDNWKLISTFESLVYPNNEETFTQAAEQIHGISLIDLEDAPMSNEVLENMEAWVRKSLRREAKDSLKDLVMCGQSVINDINFLKEEYAYLHMNWPYSFKLIDLMSLSFVFYQIFDNNGKKRPQSYSLKAVAEMFGLSRDDEQHNALEDAKLTYACFKEYMLLIPKLKLNSNE